MLKMETKILSNVFILFTEINLCTQIVFIGGVGWVHAAVSVM